MILELLPENHPQLKEVSSPWSFETDGDPSELIAALIEVMKEKNAIGIAAPQCGVQKSLFIIYDGETFLECVNPKIVQIMDKSLVDFEGCLSFPDLFMKVRRNEHCIVEYQTATGETVTKELQGLPARVYLHELDHLLGVTFDDRVGDLTYKMAKDKRKKQLKKRSRASV
jgi:peptide deformylase